MAVRANKGGRSLVPLWDGESNAARFVLVSLATFCPAQTASLVRSRLTDIPAPQGSDRGDALALAAALLGEDTDALDMALYQIATWDSSLAEQLKSPHTPAPRLPARRWQPASHETSPMPCNSPRRGCRRLHASLLKARGSNTVSISTLRG